MEMADERLMAGIQELEDRVWGRRSARDRAAAVFLDGTTWSAAELLSRRERGGLVGRSDWSIWSRQGVCYRGGCRGRGTAEEAVKDGPGGERALMVAWSAVAVAVYEVTPNWADVASSCVETASVQATQ